MQWLTHSITSSVAIKRHRHFDARYGAPSDVLVLSRSVLSMRDRMEAISATARIHHTSCRRCPYWTADGYRSDTQGLPPRYADRGSADGSRERAAVLIGALTQRGYKLGQNLTYEARGAAGQLSQMPK